MDYTVYRKHFRRNFSLAYPVMLSQLGHVMVGLADNVMVGRLGAVQLASVSLAGGVFHVVMLFGIGISLAITPMVAAANGERNLPACANYLKHGFYLNSILGILLAVGLSLSSGVLHIFDQEQEVLVHAVPYLTIMAFSIIPIMFFQIFKQFAEGLSSTRPAMVITIGGNLLNIGLNYLLIFGTWGFPELGVNGAAIASLITRVVISMVMAFFVFRSSKFKKVMQLFQWRGLQVKTFERLLRIGVPVGLQFIFEVGAFGMATVMIGSMGAVQLAAHQIALNMAAISYMAASGISAAATIRVGNYFGKHDFHTLRIAGNTCFVMVILFMTFCSVVFITFNDYLPSLYIDDPAVVGYAASLLIIAALFQISDGVQVVGLGALRGLADVKIPTMYTLFAYWVVALPLGYILGLRLEMGALGVWIGLLFGLSISAIMQYVRFRNFTSSLLISTD